jgi:hypothetical protein
MASVLAAGLPAAAILPFRGWLQHVVARAMYGAYGDPCEAVSRLTTQLQAAAAPGDGLAAIAEAIARPTGAAVYAAGLADALPTSQRWLVEAREEERRRLRRRRPWAGTGRNRAGS